MDKPERFLGYTREDIVKRQRVVAAQVRAVPDHSDDQYRRAVLAALTVSPLPMAPLMDAVAFELPRLESTPIDAYFMEGTKVDEERLNKVVSDLQQEGSIVTDNVPYEGFELIVLRINGMESDEQL